MTTQQLHKLYEAVNLPFSTDEQQFQLLKKTVLLELKMVDAGTLIVGGEELSKSDILQLFESGLPQNEVDFESFEAAHPWVAYIHEPEAIRKDIRFPADMATNPVFQAYCAEYASAAYPNFKRVLKAHMDNNDIMLSYSVLSYLPFFTLEEQFELKGFTKSLFYSKYAVIEKRASQGVKGFTSPEERLYKFPVYYDLLLLIAADDAAFLEFQLDIFEKKTGLASRAELKRIAQFQLRLPFPQEFVNWLKQLIEVANRQSSQDSDSGGSSGRIIVSIVVAVLVILLKVGLFSSRSRSYDSSFDLQQQQEWRQQFQQIIQEQELRRQRMVDSLNDTISNDIPNVDAETEIIPK